MTNKELISKIREEILHLKMKELQRTNGINTGADVYLSSYAVLSIISNALTEESEDERIRKKLYNTVMGTPNDSTWFDGTSKEAMLAWLEKQKENPKNTISIPADCATNAKCPYKIHGDEDFIGDIKDTPAYHFGFDEGVRSEREKQKESLHIPETCKENADSFTSEQKPELVQQPPITYTYNSNASRDERLKAALLALLNSDLLKVKEGGYFTKQDLIEWVERIPTDKPADWSDYKDKVNIPYCSSEPEWSEEDEDRIRQIERIAREAGCTQKLQEEIHDWLKSLRPSWKPSEEHLSALLAVFNDPNNIGSQTCKLALTDLYEQLKKL